MSRSHYSDDYGDDFPGQLDLYRANVDRAFYSRAGRAKLAELLAALDAMPVKELDAGVFINTDKPRVGPGEAPMCALGAWAATFVPDQAARLFKHVEPDQDEMSDTLKAFGWPKLVVWDIVYWNDSDGPYDETAERRWQRVRRNVANKIEEIAGSDARVAAWKATHPYTTPSVGGVGLL